MLFTHGFAIDFSMDVAFPAYMSALFFCFLSLPCPSFPVFPCKMVPAEGKAAEAEEMPPKAGGCQPRHGHERIGRKDYGPAAVVLRSIKRRKVLMNLSLKYRCLGENVLAETLPDPTACASKRKWETAIQKARETLRLMSILTQMSTLALLALMQCHVFQQGVSWSLLNLMARQILMACLIFNGFESGATARVLTSFALLA